MSRAVWPFGDQYVVFFFFQAEDGIRDVAVTGVQTCALPISIRLPDQRLAMYELAGDAFYIDAHILKWHSLANLLGVPTAYELDRVGGRYNDVAQERSRPRTVYSLAHPKPIDMFDVARRFSLLAPLVDAQYGSATFVAAGRPAQFEVRVSTTGLLIRPTAR